MKPGLFRWIRGWIKYWQMKRWMERRATGMGVKLATTGAVRTRI